MYEKAHQNRAFQAVDVSRPTIGKVIARARLGIFASIDSTNHRYKCILPTGCAIWRKWKRKSKKNKRKKQNATTNRIRERWRALTPKTKLKGKHKTSPRNTCLRPERFPKGFVCGHTAGQDAVLGGVVSWWGCGSVSVHHRDCLLEQRKIIQSQRHLRFCGNVYGVWYQTKVHTSEASSNKTVRRNESFVRSWKCGITKRNSKTKSIEEKSQRDSLIDTTPSNRTQVLTVWTLRRSW